MTDWVPRLSEHGGARYAAIVAVLEADIAFGRVKPGMRLLTQREMADRLGLSVGTISKAYAEAEKRGLISGEVGRGTFVRQVNYSSSVDRKQLRGHVNLALNIPPSTGESELVTSTLGRIVSDGSIGEFLGYLPHQGRHEHRQAIAAWISKQGMPVSQELTFITHGAQHALSIAIGVAVGRGDVVVTESSTYSGIHSLESNSRYRLHGVAGDSNGLIPDELDRTFSETQARVLFCMPTLQTPTGTVMPLERRRQIADIVRRHDAYVVEDDAYSFLLQDAPPPLSTLIPERSFYVVSFSKCLAPGLRVGALVAPEPLRDRCINAIRASGWMATPIMVELVCRMINDGDLEKQIGLKRAAAATRNAVARRVLGGLLPESKSDPGFHLWLPLPAGRAMAALLSQAAQRGITLAAPNNVGPADPGSAGVRLCLGAPSSEADLERALLTLRDILQQPESMSFV